MDNKNSANSGEKNETYQAPVGGTATGTATKPEPANTAGSQTAIKDESTSDPASGFGPFREWLNRRLQTHPAKLYHEGTPCEVEELTHDGRLRIKVGDSFAMIAFNAQTIPALFSQWTF